MQSRAYPNCCGINIIAGFDYRDVAGRFTATDIAKHEKGDEAACSAHTKAYLTAHLACVSDGQAGVKADLEAAGYRELARVKSIECPFPMLYLMGKGFEEKK